ncbi:hypothetical protein [Streptomyces sp. NPDC003487]
MLPFGIDTAIVVPGAFTTGTSHLANAGAPADANLRKPATDVTNP